MSWVGKAISFDEVSSGNINPDELIPSKRDRILMFISLLVSRVIEFNSPERVRIAIDAYGLSAEEVLPCIVLPSAIGKRSTVPQIIKKIAALELLGRGISHILCDRIHYDPKIDSSFLRQETFIALLNNLLKKEESLIDELMETLLIYNHFPDESTKNVFWIREWKYFIETATPSETIPVTGDPMCLLIAVCMLPLPMPAIWKIHGRCKM